MGWKNSYTSYDTKFNKWTLKRGEIFKENNNRTIVL